MEPNEMVQEGADTSSNVGDVVLETLEQLAAAEPFIQVEEDFGAEGLQEAPTNEEASSD